jgi:hypothetical protein
MEAFFDASDTVISDIIYAWANLLDEFFEVFFPTPSRSQMLIAYPESVIRKFGKSNIFMLMDATEIQAESAPMKLMNSALFSAYKHNSTLKWLTTTDEIGTSWHKGRIPPGHPGGASDGVMTVVTKIVRIRFRRKWQWKWTRDFSLTICVHWLELFVSDPKRVRGAGATSSPFHSIASKNWEDPDPH